MYSIYCIAIMRYSGRRWLDATRGSLYHHDEQSGGHVKERDCDARGIVREGEKEKEEETLIVPMYGARLKTKALPTIRQY